MKRLTLASLALGVIAFAAPAAQEREDRTLLGVDQLRAIVNEASGERAMHHLLEMVPYPRVRPRAEYEGRFRESDVVARFAKEYGYADVGVESFPAPQPLWAPSRGELWLLAPELRKLYDIHDVVVALGSGSASGDVTAELVDVGGGGSAEDYAGKDVKGKVVLGSAGLGQLYRMAVGDRGAVGVLGYGSIRADSYPDQVSSQGIGGGPGGAGAQGPPTGFGWSLAPRVGRELAARLARREKVTVRSVVESETFPGELEMVHAVIPGDGSTDQAVMVTAHLYEGYIKMGASDNGSGSAMTLEMGRVLVKLVSEGKLPKPKRAIHFLWVPEISGTAAWLEQHPDVKAKLIAGINFDMAGLGLAPSASFWVLHRTPDTLPTYLNDVSQSVLEYVAELNRERVRYRANGYGFTLPVLSPSGSRDAFSVKVDKAYGASDHIVFLQQGIAATTFTTWPDMWYHSSADTPDKLDPTQFRRAAVVAAALTEVVAAADDGLALKLVAESVARGTERLGASQRKGLGYLADAGDGPALVEAYKEARNAVRHQAGIEKAVVRSAAVLFARPEDASRTIAGLEASIDKTAAALQEQVKSVYAAGATLRQVAPAEPAPTDAEREAARMIPERVPPRDTPAGLPRGMAALFQRIPPEAARFVPQHMTSELNVLVGQKKTVLEIRDFLAGEFEPITAANLVRYFREVEKAGLVKITVAPEAPTAAKRKGAPATPRP